jgi:hypothetical protein
MAFTPFGRYAEQEVGHTGDGPGKRAGIRRSAGIMITLAPHTAPPGWVTTSALGYRRPSTLGTSAGRTAADVFTLILPGDPIGVLVGNVERQEGKRKTRLAGRR